MKKTISASELILLGILIIFAAYYFLVHAPVTNRLEELSQLQDSVQTETDVVRVKLEEQKKMQKEIDKAYDEANGNPKPIPEYNNLNNVLNQFHAILGKTVTYSIDFGRDETEGRIVRREVPVSFTVGSYEEAKSIVSELQSCGSGFLIESLSISDNSRYDSYFWLGEEREFEISYSVSLNIVCFEYISE